MRKLWEISQEIQLVWGSNISKFARPYIDAMSELDSITDQYNEQDARSVVSDFLTNAGGWRGDRAREIKSELKQILKGSDL
ncbi:hypothetical protein SAMN05216296_2455 [Pseudomonas pohangensis]|uniref:Uncharacterized protein n=1 Tax=Pseudomonas pohangensis TaxID=364197 RepID=A0A1H2GQ61_9PSED|nr:hypothetical protein [Pseudomonas pohangensis]SDU21645.1 hypothetical protein SAMN05216296_2455 [Pseudomonas pohangensis]